MDLGVRQKSKYERRNALITAAYALFRSRGYASTTMDDIADAAGLSRRTAFRYFSSKEELLFPFRGARLALLRDELGRQTDETPFERVRRACLSLGREYQANRTLVLEQWNVIKIDSALLMRDMEISRDFEDAIAQAFVISPHPSAREHRLARLRAAAVVGVMRATLEGWLEGGADGDLMRLGREALAELERGFGHADRGE